MVHVDGGLVGAGSWMGGLGGGGGLGVTGDAALGEFLGEFLGELHDSMPIAGEGAGAGSLGHTSSLMIPGVVLPMSAGFGPMLTRVGW